MRSRCIFIIIKMGINYTLRTLSPKKESPIDIYKWLGVIWGLFLTTAFNNVLQWNHFQNECNHLFENIISFAFVWFSVFQLFVSHLRVNDINFCLKKYANFFVGKWDFIYLIKCITVTVYVYICGIKLQFSIL